MARKKDPRPYAMTDAQLSSASRERQFMSWATMIALALATGFVIGFTVYLLLNLSEWLTALIWDGLGGRLNLRLFPLITCTVGGVIIGIWTHLSHNSIDSLEEVLGQFGKTGSYRLENPPATAVSFLLPLAFGGSVGFEAGLTGLITAACCWIRDKLKAAGLRLAGTADVTIAASLSAIFKTPLAGVVAGYESEHRDSLNVAVGQVDDYNMRREVKLVLYLAAAMGSFVGIAVFTRLFGGAAGMPRFSSIQAQSTDFLWAIPCLLMAYALLLVFHAATFAAQLIVRRLDANPAGDIIKPVIAGVALGTTALALPLVLFPGEEQCNELINAWSSWPVWALLATGILKAVVTPLCLNLGWKGGDFFPCIFAGVACGYGLAALTGVDPMLMVTVTTTAFLSGVTRKPVLALAILAICFPLDGILWMGLAALIGSLLPVPQFLSPSHAE